MSVRRWYVVRSIRLNKGDVPSGKYLTKEQEAEIPSELFKVLVRGVRLFDTTGKIDIPWRERNKLRLRHRAFMEIGTDEAKKLHDLSVERMAQGRAAEFQSPREKALAEEIEGGKAAPEKRKQVRRRKKPEPKPEPKPTEDGKTEEFDLELPEV